MRRETQINLLFLIRRLCRIYAAATACVQQSRGLIAIRSTTFACAACIADAICRVSAVDDPSPFCLHYSGDCEGPTKSFGIEAGSFESLAAMLPIYDPRMCSMRYRCLDYLRGVSLRDDGTERPTIFNFDQSLTPQEGDTCIIYQLSIQLALPRPYPPKAEALVAHAAALISGTNGAILEVLPEFECFRDVIFHFKHSVSGKAYAPPPSPDEEPVWYPSDATLKWSIAPINQENPNPVYAVKAFHNHPQEFVMEIDKDSSKHNTFSNFLSFFQTASADRSKLSSADPTNIVNSCSEKSKKK